MIIEQIHDNFGLPITEHFIKAIFRQTGKLMFGKESTADLTTIETQEVYKIVDSQIAGMTGCMVDWPADEPKPEGERK